MINEDVLDFLSFLALLGICLAVAFGIVIPATHNANVTSPVALVDKTAPSVQGYANDSNFDGALSKLEVVLMTQVQDFAIPDPKVYQIGSMNVAIDSLYKAGVKPIGYRAFDVLNTDMGDTNGTGRYDTGYSYGAPPTITDINTGNLVQNPGSEIVSADGTSSGWATWTSTPSDVKFTVRQNDPSWTISGSGSFEINSTQNVGGLGRNYTGYYYQDIPVEAGKKYRFTGSMSCHRCEGFFALDMYTDTGISQTYNLDRVVSSYSVLQRTTEFTVPVNATKVRIRINKDVSGNDSSSQWWDYLFADSISLQKLDGSDPHYFVTKR